MDWRGLQDIRFERRQIRFEHIEVILEGILGHAIHVPIHFHARIAVIVFIDFGEAVVFVKEIEFFGGIPFGFWITHVKLDARLGFGGFWIERCHNGAAAHFNDNGLRAGIERA